MIASTDVVTDNRAENERELAKRTEEIQNWSGAALAALDEEMKLELKYLILEELRIDLLCTEVLGYTLEDFHLEILMLCMTVMSERGEGLLEAPRGFGKSTIGTTAFAIFLILLNRDILILITSSTAGKAEGFLQEIKAHFEYNEVLREIFGDYVNPKGWNNTSIFVKGRKTIAKEGTVTAYGQSGQVVSKHYDVILNDDPVNEDNARTKLRRDKLEDWLHTSLGPTLKPEGFMMTTGTRYHPEDSLGKIEEKAKARIKEIAKKKQAGTFVASDYSEPPLRILKLKAILDEGKSRERSLWEDRFPLAKLKDIKRKMGSIRFGGQMQQETDLMKGKMIKEKDIMWYRRDDVNTAKLHIYQGLDLAAGKDVNNDRFAFVTKGYDPFTNRAYTLDLVHGQFSFRDQMALVLWKTGKSIEEIVEIMGYKNLTYEHLEEQIHNYMPESCWPFALRQWPQVRRIGIESNAYQKVLPMTITEMWTTIPIIMINSRIDKETRITKYSPRFENHQEFFPDDGSADILRDEAISFPDGDFDDLIDAHELCNSVKDMMWDNEDEDDEEGEVGARAF